MSTTLNPATAIPCSSTACTCSANGEPRSSAAIRRVEAALGRPLGILMDLQGPKLRVGQFAGGKAVIRHGSHFTLDRDPTPGDENRVCLPHPELFGVLEKGQRLLIDDGKLRLRVIRAEADAILCSAEVGGVISDRKGVNVPDAVVPVPALTEKDRRDLTFALEQGADWIALSFVQRPEDVAEARKLMKEAGYGPDNRLQLKVSTRNIATFKDPAVILIDQLKQIWIDGELMPSADAKVSVLSHALHYGTGVFEGIRAYETDRGPGSNCHSYIPVISGIEYKKHITLCC